jgi:hypothetical protein
VIRASLGSVVEAFFFRHRANESGNGLHLGTVDDAARETAAEGDFGPIQVLTKEHYRTCL